MELIKNISRMQIQHSSSLLLYDSIGLLLGFALLKVQGE
jgi:hypothetical protein